jgi:hypothetical protein
MKFAGPASDGIIAPCAPLECFLRRGPPRGHCAWRCDSTQYPCGDHVRVMACFAVGSSRGTYMYGFVTAKITAPARPQRRTVTESAQVNSLAVVGRAGNAHRLKKCATAPNTTDTPQASMSRTAAVTYQSLGVIRNAAESSTNKPHKSQVMRQRYPATTSSVTIPAVAINALILGIGYLPKVSAFNCSSRSGSAAGANS